MQRVIFRWHQLLGLLILAGAVTLVQEAIGSVIRYAKADTVHQCTGIGLAKIGGDIHLKLRCGSIEATESDVDLIVSHSEDPKPLECVLYQTLAGTMRTKMCKRG